MDVTSATAATGDTTQLTSTAFSSEDFYALLVAELQNQDPTNPADNSDMVLQILQLSSIDSMSNMSDSLTDISDKLDDLTTNSNTYSQISSIAAAAAMIGKEITYTDDDGATQTGTVSSVKTSDGSISLETEDGTSVNISKISSYK